MDYRNRNFNVAELKRGHPKVYQVLVEQASIEAVHAFNQSNRTKHNIMDDAIRLEHGFHATLQAPAHINIPSSKACPANHRPHLLATVGYSVSTAFAAACEASSTTMR